MANQWRIPPPPHLPHLFLDQTEARGAEKHFLETAPPSPHPTPPLMCLKGITFANRRYTKRVPFLEDDFYTPIGATS